MGTRLLISFAAGFASVITPCVLPLVPGYLSAVSSVEAGRLGERGTARRVVASSVPFVLGFTVVFVALGAGAAWPPPLAASAIALRNSPAKPGSVRGPRRCATTRPCRLRTYVSGTWEIP